MNDEMNSTAQRVLNKEIESLTQTEKKVVQYFINRLHISRNVLKEHEENMTLGQRVADKIAAFGGSWTFIFIFASILFAWIILNSYILLNLNKSFDPYPYILLNLFLSMIAAIQAPVIMMSQNRQAEKDRITALHDYEVNLKAELEISALSEKIDLLLNEKIDLLNKKFEGLEESQQGILKILDDLKNNSGISKV